ncbi:hypothetical protein [Thalassotalea euphylliae]|uniref:Lipoprotein n=1 Tax=Thalassotalea euphylliae TaxID=1655234 RepID=A0A3E0U6G1_9GAMM|nr:hypothetical protein [Thalassotalea euphylliae]REL32167.1 hypothetical protein DXX94_16385 [Thalassotalea euphylliae]
MIKRFASNWLRRSIAACLATSLTACVVVPVTDHSYQARCEISTDRKILKIVDGYKDNNTYYSISGVILLPITGIVSGAYVAVNNIYHLGEETIVCGKKAANGGSETSAK